MPSVNLDHDVYDYLLRNAIVLGEDASAILRRLLPGFGQHPHSASPALAKENGSVRPPDLAVADFVRSRAFSGQRNTTERFLALLGFLHECNEAEFEKVLALKGRKRSYFGTSEAEIRKSGRSTHPRQIPTSSYWVLTNAGNHHKREILRRVLQVLGYSYEAVLNVARS